MTNEETEARDIISKCEQGSTPEMVKRLRHLLLSPPLRRRIGQSATMIDLKLKRLTSPAESGGLRVPDAWSDFANWIGPEEIPPIEQKTAPAPKPTPMHDAVDPKLQSRDCHTTNYNMRVS
jgi:hypothetical protein